MNSHLSFTFCFNFLTHFFSLDRVFLQFCYPGGLWTSVVMQCFCLSLLNSCDNGCVSLCLAFLIFLVCLLGLANPSNLISVTRLTYHVLLNKADDYCLALSENNAFYFYMILLEMSLFYWAQIWLPVAFTICWSFLETGVEAQIFNSYFNSTHQTHAVIIPFLQTY